MNRISYKNYKIFLLVTFLLFRISLFNIAIYNNMEEKAKNDITYLSTKEAESSNYIFNFSNRKDTHSNIFKTYPFLIEMRIFLVIIFSINFFYCYKKRFFQDKRKYIRVILTKIFHGSAYKGVIAFP